MKYNIYDTVVTVFGVSFTAENFQTAIGIIVGILTLINIIVKMYFRIKDAIKKKKYSDVNQIIEESIEEIKEVGKDVKNK